MTVGPPGEDSATELVGWRLLRASASGSPGPPTFELG